MRQIPALDIRLLQPPERLLNMPRAHGRPGLLGRIEQPRLAPALLAALLLVPAAVALVRVFDRFDFQRLLGEQRDDLVRQEAQNVHDVVVGLAVRHDAEARPLAETLAFAEGERCLSALGEVQIFLGVHAFGALVGLLEARERGGGHFVFLFVFFVFALGDLFAVETRHVPGQADFGFFVLAVARADAGSRAERGVVGGQVEVVGGGVGTTFVVAVFGAFAHVFP